VAANSIECFSLLIAQTHNQVRNREGSTAADLIFLLKRKELLNILVPIAILPTKLNQNGQSLLHQACEDSNNVLVNLLLDKVADADGRDNAGRTPLELLTWKRNKPLIEKLMRRGCDWKSVLLKAASGGQHPNVALLLDYAQGNHHEYGLRSESWK
jgi:ankyrin repeat protein